MSDIKINPDWFKNKNSDQFDFNRENLSSKLNIDDVLENEILLLPEKGKELVRLILSKNNKSIKPLKKSIWEGRSTPVNFYEFTKNLKIQSIPCGIFYINLFNKGYFLVLTDVNKGKAYTVCEIDRETIDALYPGSFRRQGKMILFGLANFVIFVLMISLFRLCSSWGN